MDEDIASASWRAARMRTNLAAPTRDIDS